MNMKQNEAKDLDDLLGYIFETEAENFVDYLCEKYPEEADYIRKCVEENNWESIDKYAWNNPDMPDHVYALAVRNWRALGEATITKENNNG